MDAPPGPAQRRDVLRRDFDLDAAQKVLNHANAKTTEIYAALDLAKAKEVMEKAG